MKTPTDTRRLRHLSEYLNPRDHGLTPHHIAFTLPESAPVPSMLDEGVVYCHPEQTEEVICWAENEAAISKVLHYHYGRKWNSLKISQRQPKP
jgi:hypothetical protein